MINTDDLCDAQGVADLVGLRHANSVHTYLRRYADMPRPVIELGPGRPRLWLRPQIEAWLTVRTGTAQARAGGPVDAAVPRRTALAADPVVGVVPVVGVIPVVGVVPGVPAGISSGRAVK